MNYLINEPNFSSGNYTKEDILKLLEEKKISLNTEIWTELWGKWKKIRDTDFNPNFKERAEKENEEPANVGLIILSLLIPIAGFILFFVHFRTSRINAMRYAQFGFLGFALARMIFYLMR